jgi:protein-tyrosine phosphatase
MVGRHCWKATEALSGLADIHAHLLPGIDDGPDDLEQALEMARAAVGAGIGTIAVTPHLRDDFPGVHVEEIGERCAALRRELEREEVPLRVVEGAEASLVWALEAEPELLRMASYGQAGTDLLIETPHEASAIDHLLYPLLGAGYRITLAHPERSPIFHRDPSRLTRLADQGIMVQINAGSLLGSGRSPVRVCAERLCTYGVAHVIASDGHRGSAPRPVVVLPEGIDAAAELIGPERARWMASDAPEAIIEGRALPTPPEIVPAPPRRRFFGLRR